MSKNLTPNRSWELVENPNDRPGAAANMSADPQQPGSVLLDEDQSQVDLGRYVFTLLRYKWWIILAILVGTAGGFALAQFVAPEYAARTTLWIETGSSEAQAGPIRPDELLESSSWIELLRSARVVEPVVLSLNLFVEPEERRDSTFLSGMEFKEQFAPGAYRVRTDPTTESFVLQTAAGVAVERGEFGDSVGAAIGLAWVPDLAGFPADRPVGFALRSPRDVANELINEMDAELDPNGNFLRLTLQGEDPQVLAATLNQLADHYVDVAADLKRGRLDELVSILEQQVDYAAERLRQAEIALEDFRVETVTLPSDRSTPVSPGLEITRDPVFGNFFGMRVELEGIRRERDLIRQALASDSAAALQTLRGVETVQQSAEMNTALDELTGKRAELRALRYRYTDQHPPVRQLLGEIEILESQTIPALAQNILSDLATRERQLESRLGAASEELEEIPPRTIEEARLTRSVMSADNLYSTLLSRYEEARLSAASSVPDVRVLDRAIVPREPLADEKATLILLGLMGGLGLGVLGALLRDRMDRRLYHPEQVTEELGLSILAGIPRIREGRWGGQDNRSQAQEAFRALRLNATHAYGTAGPLTVTVTSPGPGDGKSFVAANLGRAFADIGRRTLLIDGDTRRGKLHEIFGVDRKPGLIDLLKETGTGDGSEPPVRGTEHQGLFLLPCGSRVHEGPELLSTPAMRDVVLQLRSEFDVIIVDSPPLGAGVDPFVLGTLTGAMLMVLRTGETDRVLADNHLDLLARLPIRLLGAVLNGVPDSREYRYYSYTAGYETISEEEVPAPALLKR